MKKILLHILAVSLMVASCKKDTESDFYTEDFRFFMKGQVNGLPFEYNAGEEGYYMETDFYQEDSVLVMEGRLVNDATPGRNALTVRIRGNQSLSQSGQFTLEENIVAKPYSFRDATGFSAQPGKYQFNFYGDTNNLANMSYEWFFGDNSQSFGPSVSKTVDINEHAVFPVRMETSYAGNCRTGVTHFVNVEKDCDATFSMQLNTPGEAQVRVISRIGTVSSVEWFLGDIEVEPGFTGVIDLTQNTNADSLRCIVHFADGCTRRIDRGLGGTTTNPCITDFWYTKHKPTTFDPNQYSTIEIEYYDDKGKKYTSYYTQVQGDFEVTSASHYHKNESGQQTVRFFLETDVILKNSDGSTVELQNTFGSMAVAHP